MTSPRTCNALVFTFAFALAFLNAVRTFAVSAKSQVIVRELQSENIAHNKAGTDPVRKMLIYLPAGYDEASSQRYPVIYFLPNPFEDSYRFDFDHRDAQGLFDRAIAEDVIKKFILVAADMNTPLGSSWYVNSSATGNWEDFMVQELEDMELSASACGIQKSLALYMQCTQWGLEQVSGLVRQYPNGISWLMPNPWMT
jgi:S-formylglutathione hydrolase FrmB